ncbi:MULTISPECIES: tetratricopeptide repeat protein [unclassified Streptomyces]|uniref:tetratricopeptide repeat protein n=1 Tax=unclassified Streptomyces TaxID=2593676 RepID=UPI00093A122E|nr:tetratricopeptide repeat protein [Streptomyces sp. TSRI0107]OKJ85365.1 regulator [Streptomyces sp. TSRI0107]
MSADHVDFRGGNFYGPVTGLAQAPAPTALDSLPVKAAGFTGRDSELARLLDALDPDAPGEPKQAVLVTAVSGLGGIGKTALAVEAAHTARERGWFPGGVLLVDLHGYDDVPVTADQALQSLLRALGVEPEHIPVAADEQAVLYRSVLAGRARERGPLLILADNASSPEQVRPLVPGSARHRVLVTSRDRLPQLGARLVPLDELTPREAYDVLDLALRIADPGDSRVGDDPVAVERLAVLCGHLPLALQIAAALLVEDREMPVGELVGELAESRDRLSYLDDGERSVRAAFDLSYRRLPAAQARLLRLLALAPGPEVSEEVVAALVGADKPPSGELKALARAHLVERGSKRGWWRLHDLVRVFGAGVVAREEGDAARERVLGMYFRWASAADKRLRWLPGRPVPDRFADRKQALAWLDGERAGLVAAALWSREDRFADTAVGLAVCLAEYLDWRRYFDDLLTITSAAREAAHRSGNRVEEGMAWDNLGLALQEMDRMEEAVDAHIRARDVFQEAGARDRESKAWNNLGLALRKAGRMEEAIDAHIRDRELCQAVGDHHGEALAWNNLGLALRRADRVEEAIDAHTRARDTCQAVGDRRGEGMAWNNLGLALHAAGRVEEAMDAYGKDLDVCREFEDWYGAGRALQNLALAHRGAHRLAEARTHYVQAADVFIRANAPAEADQARAWAAALSESPAPTDKPTPASPPAHTTDSAQPSPHPPDAPGTAGP